ncbi:MAG TPA: hypothetical protein VKU87_11140 [Thermomicrobiaceae bacterium]|nr:hypothetical protein [Thermomicrobiaceae bacterium]
MPVPLHLMTFTFSNRLLLALGFLGALFGLTLLHTPGASAAARSVTVVVNNTGDLPLYRQSASLDHGSWTPGKEPPGTIAPHSTVTWASESDGVATGTEGQAKYVAWGARDDDVFYFHWDNPFIGTNSFHSYGPNPGCSSTHNNPDGNDTTVTFTVGCAMSDGDGIADLWKLKGAYFYPGGDPSLAQVKVDLPGLGAKVGEKEIFVQLDWMANSSITQRLNPAAIERVADAFKAQGIRLFVDQGFDSVLDFTTGETWGNRSQARAVTYQASLGTTTPKAGGGFDYDWTAFRAIRDTGVGNFKDSGRAPIFHYALAAHNLGSVSNSGIGDLPGANFIVSLGSFTGGTGTVDQQAGTFMHELGHNLGLHHGGNDEVNYKPNYLSVMNYLFQMSNVIKGGAGTLDYSHSQLPSLDENHLNEAIGLGAGANGYGTEHYCAKSAGFVAAADATAVDWDCDGKPISNDVKVDVNNDGSFDTLNGFNDWGNIVFAAGGIGSAGATEPPAVQSMMQELTPELLVEIKELDTTPPVTTATPDNPANANGWNNTTVKVTLTATDDISGVATTEYNLDGAGWQTYSAPIVIAPEGTHTLLFHSIDLSTNQEDDKSLTIKIDKTLPTIPTPVDGQRYTVGTSLTFTCADALSGIEACKASISRLGKPVTTVSHGDALPTGSPGAFTLTPTDIHDQAGNYLTTPVHYTVAYDVTPLAGYTDTVKTGYWARVVVALRDANKKNLSKRTLKVNSLRLERLDAGNTVVQKIDFAYAFQFGTIGRDDGYQLEINSRNLALGSWRLVFTTSDAPDVELATVFTVVK